MQREIKCPRSCELSKIRRVQIFRNYYKQSHVFQDGNKDTLESDSRRPSWPPSWKLCNCCYCVFHNWTWNLSVSIDRHCIRLCSTWTQSWDTSDSNFRRPFWLPSWKICNWCYWFLHIHILRPWFHINRHFICLCIQKESWDTRL